MIHFVSGLPRSGSTLLMNILGQNPRFGVSGTSGMLEIMFGVRNLWDKLEEHQTMDKEESQMRKQHTLFSIVHGYHAGNQKEITFDKARGHPAHIEMLEWTLGRQIKMIVTVRDVRDILSSLELQWREGSQHSQIAIEEGQERYLKAQTVAGRCETWAKGMPVGLAYDRIKDAIHKGHRDKMHFIHFEELTKHPKSVMNGIYEFLEEEPFEHDFNNVQQVTHEDDRIHGMDLHTIRPKVEPVPSRWQKVLGKQLAQRYAGLTEQLI